MKFYFSIKKIIFLLIISSFFSSSFKVGAQNFDQENSNQTSLTDKKFENYLKKLPNDVYLIGSSDVIRISISPFYYPELNGDYAVDEAGTIFVPRLKRIYVKGLTVSELTKLLNNAYKEYVKFPEVEVNLIKYRPLKILVKGEVQSPSQYTLKGSFSPLRLSDSSELSGKDFYFPELIDAIRAAGGINTYSDLENIQIIRNDTLTNGGGQKTTTVDFKKTLTSNTLDSNFRIYDGDTILVPRLAEPNPELLSSDLNFNMNPNFIEVFVSGRVRSRGRITMNKLSTLNDAIDFAGGTRIIKGKITFLRIKKTGAVEKRIFSHSKKAKGGSFKNPYLKNKDAIFVGDNLLSATSEVIGEITSPLKGVFSTYGLYKVLERK